MNRENSSKLIGKWLKEGHRVLSFGFTMHSLSHVRIFAEISAAEMQSITPKLQPFSIEQNEVLFYHGDKASTLYIIEKGEVAVYANASGDKNIRLSTLGKGSLIGEMSLISPSTRSATVKATQKTNGWLLSCDAFDLLCRQKSPAALKMLRNLAALLCERLRAMPFYGANPQEPLSKSWFADGTPSTPDPQYNDFLQQLDFFNGFLPNEITTVMSKMKQWFVPRGEMLFEDGAPGNSAFLILRGGVEESIIENGKKHQLSILGPGKIFGLLSLLDNKPRYATCIARERCLLLEMPGESFHELFNLGDDLAFRFLQAVDQTLSEALRRASQKHRTKIIITDLLSPH